MRAITAEDLASVGLDVYMVCERKKRYSIKTAHAVALAARKRSNHMNIRAYRCPVGKRDHWHVGHESRRLSYLLEDIRNGKK